MITPINFQSLDTNKYLRNTKIKKQEIHVYSQFELSNYTTSQAILTHNHINFKQQEKLLPLTLMYNKELNTDNIELCYLYDSNKKNDTLAYYTGMLLLFLTPPFHSDAYKKSSNGKNYLSMIISTKGYDLKTYGDCYEKQKESIQAVYDTPFETTLESMKKLDIEIQQEDFNNGLIDDKTKDENLKIIKSITVQDIREYIVNVLLDKKPVLLVK